MAVTVPVAAEVSAESGRTVVAAPRVLEPPAEAPAYEAPEEFSLPMGREEAGTKEKAATFAPAPESLVAEPDEVESVVTASRDPILGEPAFWVPAEESPEEGEEAPSQDEDLTDHTWSSEGRTAPLRDDPPAIEKPAPAAAPQENLVIAEAVPEDLVQDAIAPAATATPAPPAAPDSGSVYSKERSAEDTLPLPDAWIDSTALEVEPVEASLSESAASAPSAESPVPLPPPSAAPVTSAPLASAIPPIPATPASTALGSEKAPNEHEIPVLELAEPLPEWASPEHAFEDKKPEPTAQEQTAKPDLEAESRARATKPEPAAHQEPEPAPQQPESEPEAEVATGWPPAFIPAISSGVNDARASALKIVPAAHTAPEAPEPEAAPETPVASGNPLGASPSPEAVEAAIQRVMERMQPQIAELVTRDILRPLVEALVQKELKK